jgi:hypothetical protein
MPNGVPATPPLDPGVWVSLSGESLDLEEVTKLFSQSQTIRIRGEGDSYYLTEPDLVSLSDDVARRDRAVEIVELVNGAARLHWANHQDLRVGSQVVTIGEDGSRTQSIVLPVEPAIVRTRAMGVAVVVGGVRVPTPPPAPPRWVEAALHDDDVAAALRILADPDVPWGRLYHVFEIVQEDVGSGISQWATPAECNRFTHTANNRLALGDEARHGHTRFQAPSTPMTLGQARELVRRIVTGWLGMRVP